MARTAKHSLPVIINSRLTGCGGYNKFFKAGYSHRSSLFRLESSFYLAKQKLPKHALGIFLKLSLYIGMLSL